MPKVQVVLYQEEQGRVPLIDWLDDLNLKARAKCLVRLERLAELGHGLRRPEADYLRDEIYELRAKHAGINYRILSSFIKSGLLLSRMDSRNNRPRYRIVRSIWQSNVGLDT